MMAPCHHCPAHWSCVSLPLFFFFTFMCKASIVCSSCSSNFYFCWLPATYNLWQCFRCSLKASVARQCVCVCVFPANRPDQNVCQNFQSLLCNFMVNLMSCEIKRRKRRKRTPCPSVYGYGDQQQHHQCNQILLFSPSLAISHSV